MTEAQLLDRVRDLREQGRSPKQIARALGLSPATVVPLVRRLAQERPAPPYTLRWSGAG
jgi:DNA-binding CsgD family transcriptional regulator